MQPISTYLNETSVFTYELSIRVNSKTYIDRIIAFERAFLTLGEEYGFFVAVPFKSGIHLSLGPLLDKYEKERHISLEQRKTEAISLLNFQESKYLRNRVAYVGLDVRGAEFTDGVPVAPIDFTDEEQLREARKMMELIPLTGPLYEDLMDEFYWEEYLKVRIRSSANIWLETLPAVDDFSDERDNRAVAGRVVPVFNAFLRALRALAEADHGSVTLVDTFSDLVTEEGVLLGGEVVFE
ncbi:hypothetical protein [Neolewinella persica]|uniref:hypothetical protein n=1 Tax=Neolewinella persica TaxID=70998 RepID=UPI000360B4B6|nr:hypothetical protein [Neolewinella persica]